MQSFIEKPTSKLKKAQGKHRRHRSKNNAKVLKKILKKNNSKKAYQLVKELISLKQGKTTTIQDKAGKCLIEEQDNLMRWTEHCSELYTHTHTQQQEILRC